MKSRSPEIAEWRIGRAAASMECGGNDTALARPRAYKSKVASRPPHSTWRLMLVLAALLPSSAFAQSHQADTKATKPTAPTPQPAAVPPPITFARSGQEVEVKVLPPFVFLPPSKKAVVLTAFGRTWTKPSDVVQTSAWSRAKITIPQVRVPTVFAVVNHSKEVVGEVVAYPNRDVQWDNITLYSYAAATWFSQWAAATGLPVKQVPGAEFATAGLATAVEGGKSLLILGPGAQGNDLSYVAKLASDKKVNILVLEARWFGELARPVSVAPSQMFGGLSEIAKQRWPKPLKFSSHRMPWPGIANRWAWIADGNGLPLVEEVAWYGGLWASRLTVSYVPWQGQLGRREHADELLVSLLTSASTLEMRKERDPIEVWMVYPPNKQVEPKGRPVLSSSIRNAPYSIIEARSVSILDLRGTEKLPAELLGECRKIEDFIGPREGRKESDLLILGDDKLLDDWKWLKLDRAKKTINRPGVVWLSDDELPPSKDNQIRLMLKLTELGVPLVPPSQEEKKQ